MVTKFNISKNNIVDIAQTHSRAIQIHFHFLCLYFSLIATVGITMIKLNKAINPLISR